MCSHLKHSLEKQQFLYHNEKKYLNITNIFLKFGAANYCLLTKHQPE